MKRDLHLIRQILLAIEASSDDEPASIKLPIAEYSDVQISHHVHLLKEAGLIHAIESHRQLAVRAWLPHSLTWQGHEFLDAIRSESIWQSINNAAAATTHPLPASVIQDIGLREIRRAQGLA
jgi:hypothetical protein